MPVTRRSSSLPPRHAALVAVLCSAAIWTGSHAQAAVQATEAASSACPTRQPTATLATPEQLGAEREALRILADPKAIAAKARFKERLNQESLANGVDDKWLSYAVNQWATSLALREAGPDAARPAVIRDIEPALHTWHGISFPGAGTAGDSPDNVYRFTGLDGRYKYILTGHVAPDSVRHYSLDVRAGSVRHSLGIPAAGKRVDSGVQLGMLDETAIKVDPCGNFEIAIDGESAPGRSNHIQIPAGPAFGILRNIFDDWRERPTHFSIRRVDSEPTPPALTTAARVDQFVADLAEWSLHNFYITKTLMGNPPINTVPTPAVRDGGWGRLTITNFKLADDEALVVQLDRAGAPYTGAQVTGPYMVSPDHSLHHSSLNISQSKADASGVVTYVLSGTDPHVPNWLDTTGLHQGTVVFRWTGVPTSVPSEKLVRSVRVVKLNAETTKTLQDQLGVVTAKERHQEMTRRRAEYVARSFK
ncbi:hypothetical protein [Novosphingobium sp. 9U]|uniref:hypothetical protein n=1 Tax=Novosphingobium sp. 9U TaxID=2653158 RepID=UPI0012F1AB72|nr:hypothetical protein [Novosphingobium sp. 9U]VWX50584.1 putative G2 [Novosphingobium sp. 9U]